MTRPLILTLTALLLFCLTASAQIIIGPEDDPTYIDTTADGSPGLLPPFTEYLPATSSYEVSSVNVSGLDCSQFPTTCLYVDVLDSNGVPIPGLPADSFCVYQDGVPIDSFSVIQLNADSCVTSVCFVVDLSGSMRNEGRLDSAQAAMHRFVDNMDPFDRVAIVGFSDCVTLEMPFTSDQSALHTAIDSLDAHGVTAMFDGIWYGVSVTLSELGAKAVIAYSDGLENGSQHCWPPPDGITSAGQNNYLNDSVLICDLANSAGIPIYTFNLDMIRTTWYNPYALQAFATGTGGFWAHAPDGGAIDSVYGVIKGRMCSRYYICYESLDTVQNGDWHTTTVCFNGSEGCEPCDSAMCQEADAPHIVRTLPTIHLSDTCQSDTATLNVCAYITDSDSPVGDITATLFYRMTAGSYSSTPMTLSDAGSGDSTFCATIPGGTASCLTWIDYYITASDGQATVSSPQVNPQVLPYRIDMCDTYPPVADAGADQTIFQCTPAEICWAASCTDPDNNLASCSLYSGPPGATYDGSNICFTPTGTLDYEFILRAADSCGGVDYDTVVIYYTLNSAPVANAGNDSTLFLCQSEPICWPAGCTDPDGNLFSCTLTSGTGTFDGSNICFTPTVTGVYEFVMQAADSCGLFHVDTSYIDVTINSTPVCTAPADTTIYQCTPAQVCLPWSVSDADGNLDVCQISSGQGSLVGSDWCYTPSADQTVVVTLHCEDSCNAYCESQFTVQFELNDAPTITLGNDTTVFLCGSEEVCLPYTATDPDTWQSTSVSLVSGTGTLNTTDSTVCFTPGSAGLYSFVLEIEDDCSATDQDTINVTIEMNSPPVADAGADQSPFQCAPAEICWAAGCSDVDGNLAICELVSGTGTYDGTDICFTPTASGSYDFILKATDSCGATHYDTATVEVTINSAPTVTAQSDTSLFLCESQTVCVSYVPTDPDGPTGLVEAMVSGYGSIDTASNTVCFTPGASGDYQIIIGVTDPCGQADRDTVVISVTFGEVAQITCPTGTFSEFLCGPDSIIQTLAISPDSAAVSVTYGTYADGALRFYADSPGSYNITVIASVQCGADTCELNFDVTHNAPPVANAGADQSLFQCAPTQVCWAASCSDPDGNLTDCSLVSGPGTYDGSNICFTPTGTGSYQFILRATDACGATDEDTVNIDITINSAPTVVAQADTTVFQCTPGEICVYYAPSDPDGLTGLTETMISGYGTHDPDNDRICFTPTGAGDYQFIIGVTDPCSESDQDTVIVSVNLGETAQITCPTGTFNEFLCGPDSIIQALTIAPDSATVTVSEGIYDAGAVRFYADTPGTYNITVIAAVECGADTCVLTFDVTHNAPPVANAGTDQFLFQCNPTQVCWAASCSDPDGNLTACDLISGVGTYDGTNICFTPTGPGSYDFVLRATDACGATDYDTVTVDITINSAPTVTAQADTSLFLCTAQEICVYYTPSDPDGLTGLTETMIAGYGTHDPSNDRICFTPTSTGTYEFIVQVSDPCGLTDRDTVEVSVTFGDAAQIDCPVSPFDVFLCDPTQVCQLIDITPSTATVSVSHGTYSGGELCFYADTAGTYVITVIAEDDCGSDTCYVTFNVEIGEEPQIACPGPQSRFICETGTVCIPVGVVGAGATVTVSPIGTYSGGNLCFTADTSGTYDLRLIATTDCGVDTCDVSVTVTINSNPVAVDPATPVDTFMCNPDQVCYQFSATDIDGGSLTWSRLFGDGTLSATGLWCFNASGTETKTVTAVVTDSCGAADTTTLTYNIDMNDAPVVTLPNDLSVFVCDGDSYCFNYTATDADNNISTELLVGGTGTIDAVNDEVCFTPTASGTYQFIVEATDACGAAGRDTINITVELGQPVALTCPGDTAEFHCAPTQICRPVGVSIPGATVTASPIGTYSAGQVCFDADTSGHYVIEVIATSACGADTCEFVVDVTLNSNPVAADPGPPVDTFVCDPVQLCYQFDASDIDGGSLTWTRLAGDGTITTAGLWCFNVTATGSKTVTAVVTDPCGARDTISHTYNVTLNTAPVVSLGNDYTVFVCNGDSHCFGYSVSDLDDNVVLEELISGPGTINTGTNEVCFTPTASGTYQFIVRATDACGALDEDTLNVTVDLGKAVDVFCPGDTSLFLCGPAQICRPVDIPIDTNVVVSPIGTYDNGEVCFYADTAGHYVIDVEARSDCGNGSCQVIVDVIMNSAPVADDPTTPVDTFICNPDDIQCQLTASDVDGGTLTWSKLTGSDGTITEDGLWTFTASATGSYTIYAVVTDPCGAADTTELTYNVTLNTPPVIAFARSIATVFACGSQDVCVTYTASDIDDNIALEENLSGFGTIDTLANEVCFFADTIGTYRVLVQVTDACGAIAVDTIDVSVWFNSPPVANAGVDQSLFQCTAAPICWNAGCTDVDVNLVTCELTTEVGSYDGTQICFTPDTAGTYTFILRAEDECAESDEDTVLITVTLNSPPVCQIPNDTAFFQCVPVEVSLPVSATDIDDNFHHCEILSGPGSIAGGNWSYTPSTSGTVKVVVSCLDDCDAACTDSFNVSFDLNNPPVVSLGNDTTLGFCGSGTVLVDVDVTDEDNHPVTVAVESAFGTYDPGTGQVSFNVNYGNDRSYTLIVSATDSCGATDYDTSVISVNFNQAPTVEAPPDFLAYLDQIGEVCFDVDIVDDEDNCLLSQVDVDPVGEYDPATGQVCFDADSSGTYCLIITARDVCDSVGVDTICVEVQIDECIHVQIEKVHNALQGHIQPVAVYLTGTGTGKELGGFDFLIAYDASALTPTHVSPGAILDDCGWEYFTYRFGADGNCTGCPSGLLRIVGVAETNNGAYHPGCYLTGKVGSLAIMEFLVSNNRTMECQYVPIQFFWLDCPDNSFSSREGDTMWVSRHVYDWQLNSIEDYNYGFPGFFGTPWEPCLNGAGEDKYKPIRCVDFTNGGIDIICADSIDARGDINLNGLAYEVADAVMFTNYFIYGLDAFGTGMQVEGSIAASDVNADGITLTVADLVYLIRAIVGDMPEMPKIIPGAEFSAEFALSGNTLSVTKSSSHIGAIHLVVEGNVHPTLHPDVKDMQLQYRFDGADTRVLIYNQEASAYLGEGPVLDLNDAGRVKTIEVGSYEGYMMKAEIANLPDSYSLSQNYPNPFNPRTIIEFALPQRAEWKLVVYNVLGQVVETFEDESDPGYHKVEWDAGRYASGIYFYRLTVGEFSATRKMVLLK